MIVTRAISLTNFLVASSALGFQVLVLYPWHKELDAGFEDLKKEHLKVLDAVGNSLSEQQRRAFSDKLSDLKSQSSKSIHNVVTRTQSPGEPIKAARDKIMPTKDKAVDTATTEEAMGVSLYARYALAGAFCCAFTHAVLTPVDVVKTRIQLDPTTYSSNISQSARQIVSSEGRGALLIGLGPTIAGYCLQGAFKFGGYEYFKARAVDYLGHSTATNNRNAVYLASAAAAEFLGDIALCPFESVRIRLVSQPTYAVGFVSGLAKLAREEGLSGLYSGLSPILLKQIPYTMATFLVYEKAIQTAYSIVDKSELTSMAVTGINLGAGLVSGLAAAVVSQPADTILSKINKERANKGESTTRRLVRIATGLGLRGAYTGMQARAIMVGGMTAVQFGIYGDIKKLFGATDGVELSQSYPVVDRLEEVRQTLVQPIE
ncbi:mitochondrial phosphate carrier protein [Microdochium trichocladiopsis]|uniref:Mitochondrial phosphate carrier protein n=1 Tax=Microdochium trichocladiopsis TaxID=1682393 RepID=A0A9P9BM53_9PEZI|nr:mitochondrial phosphate carrier protein [Microdochium trichocladiopsis]KAH7016075.1 mitochondrial phosphate carrier protein [Microdochium trichocladiopsis]